MAQNNILCPIPWHHAAIKNNGQLRICSHANTSPEGGLLKNADNEFLSLPNNSIDESRNSPTLCQTRREMLQGTWPAACDRCRNEELSGLKSRRLVELKNPSGPYDISKMQSLTNPDGTISNKDFPLHSYDIRFGNVCNLKCRMCGPSDSKSWYGDYVKLNKQDFFTDSHGVVKINTSQKSAYDWHEQTDLWDHLENQAPHLRYLYLVGGEPLMIERHYDFLDWLCKKGLASQITVEYNTNLTLLPEKIFPLWQQFKEIKLGVSLDGVGPINDYVRHPSSFEKIFTHIKKLDSLNWNNLTLWLSPTVQIYNIHHLTEILDWVWQQNFHFTRKNPTATAVSLHLLHNPIYLNIQSLPLTEKQKISEELTDYAHVLRGRFKYLRRRHLLNLYNALMGIVQFMNSQDTSSEFKNFVTFNTKMDALRRQKLSSIHPRLSQLVEAQIHFNNNLKPQANWVQTPS